MGLKAGWLALFIFVWVIGAFLGSTFDYDAADASQGTSYSTGTATFTTSNNTVLGAGTVWDNATMYGGIIKSNTDDVWYKIDEITDATHLELKAPYIQAGGAGHNYTMQASPGWAGVGTGGYANSPTSTLGTLMQSWEAIQRNPIIGVISIVTNGEFWGAVYKVLLWRWSFLDDYMMVYWIFLFPFVCMGMLSVLLLAYGIVTGNLTWS